jgi:alkanesulfonate monooxygenase SsuD/methylene tetrahydromethanopterin reductase-like flavin-dependent oxidoreductase (luciferase family)
MRLSPVHGVTCRNRSIARSRGGAAGMHVVEALRSHCDYAARGFAAPPIRVTPAASQPVHPEPRPSRGAWRHPAASPLALTDIRYYQELAQRAEAGLFDSIFLADQLALADDAARAAASGSSRHRARRAVAGRRPHRADRHRLDDLHRAVQPRPPVRLARPHQQRGRIGWNIVTSWLPPRRATSAAGGQLSHADRYERAEEFVQVVKALWDSWADDAVVDDRAGGRLCAADRIRAIDHKGPTTGRRAAQPAALSAGPAGAGAGRDRPTPAARFAARHAEAVFTAQMEKATAQEFYADLKQRWSPPPAAIPPGADPAGLSPMIASTEAEASADARAQRATDPESRPQAAVGPLRRARLLAPAARPAAVAGGLSRPETVEAARSRTEVIVGLVRREPGMTLRQLLASSPARAAISPSPARPSRSPT